MTIKNTFHYLLLSLILTSGLVRAETNLEGDFIMILDGNSPSRDALDPSFNITPDPKTNPDAMRYTTVSFDEAINKNLKVMDATALTLLS